MGSYETSYGIWLKFIPQTIANYNGEIQMNPTDDMFSVVVLTPYMYLKHTSIYIKIDTCVFFYFISYGYETIDYYMKTYQLLQLTAHIDKI